MGAIEKTGAPPTQLGAAQLRVLRAIVAGAVAQNRTRRRVSGKAGRGGKPPRGATTTEEHVAAGMDLVKVVIEDGTTVGRTIPCVPPEPSDAVTAEAHRRG